MTSVSTNWAIRTYFFAPYISPKKGDKLGGDISKIFKKTKCPRAIQFLQNDHHLCSSNMFPICSYMHLWNTIYLKITKCLKIFIFLTLILFLYLCCCCFRFDPNQRLFSLIYEKIGKGILQYDIGGSREP